ncbi:hypothetical protein [Campylobacter sp. LR185c]|uniref:hypothetical protein n=1 Tax=Campylobacter sp. LR185c TaxID=2014525 RepID=UPI00168110CA|nr:hypothetical protein [Campylobacter sp. LR185c]
MIYQNNLLKNFNIPLVKTDGSYGFLRIKTRILFLKNFAMQCKEFDLKGKCG